MAGAAIDVAGPVTQLITMSPVLVRIEWRDGSGITMPPVLVRIEWIDGSGSVGYGIPFWAPPVCLFLFSAFFPPLTLVTILFFEVELFQTKR